MIQCFWNQLFECFMNGCTFWVRRWSDERLDLLKIHRERQERKHCTSIGMLLAIHLSSSTKEWQISPQAQDQCIIWFNLCLQQIDTNQAVKVWSIQTFKGDKLSRFVALFVTELIIFICEMKLDLVCNDFLRSNNSSIKCHSQPVVK